MAQNQVTGVEAEVLHTGTAKARVTGVEAEVLHTGAATARVTSVAAEVLIPVVRASLTLSVARARHRDWVVCPIPSYHRKFAPTAAVVIVASPVFQRRHTLDRFVTAPQPSRPRKFSPVAIVYTGSISLLWGV